MESYSLGSEGTGGSELLSHAFLLLPIAVKYFTHVVQTGMGYCPQFPSIKAGGGWVPGVGFLDSFNQGIFLVR